MSNIIRSIKSSKDPYDTCMGYLKPSIQEACVNQNLKKTGNKPDLCNALIYSLLNEKKEGKKKQNVEKQHVGKQLLIYEL